MAHDAPAGDGKPTKLVIRNIGLMLSGAIENPILDADTIVAENGRITAFGREKDRRHRRGHNHRRRQGLGAVAWPDRQPCPPGGGRLDAAAEPTWVDRLLSARRRHDDDLGRRGAHARPAARHRRPQSTSDYGAASLLSLPPFGRESARWRSSHRARHGRGGFQRTRRRRRQAARRGRPRLGQGRRDRAPDGSLGAQIRHPEHHPHRRTVDPRLRTDRQGRGARSRHRYHRPCQWRPHRPARRPDRLPVRAMPSRAGVGSQRQRTRRAA